MILQALYELYTRKLKANLIAVDGFTTKGIDFLIVIGKDGKYVDFKCMQERIGKRLVGKPYDVPAIGKQAEKHTNSGKDANLLWDKAEFALGVGKKGDLKLKSFIETIQLYYPSPPEDVRALLKFLFSILDSKDNIQSLLQHQDHGEAISSGSPTISFIILQDEDQIFCKEHVIGALENFSNIGGCKGVCLITGESNVAIEETHLVLKGILGAQTSGANLVSFNAPAFNSYGKQQANNAPVSKVVAARYAKALKSLVDKPESNVRIADTTVVFWAQKKAEEFDLESDFVWLFKSDKDDPERGTEAVRSLYKAVDSGRLPLDENNRFYVLGLSPNAARISVRFWKTGTVKDFAIRIKQHFEDFMIKHYSKIEDESEKYDCLSLYQILSATALQHKMDNVPPNLAGDVVVSVLDGTPYPRTLLHQCVRRIRAEQKVTRARAAILKACINRFNRFYNKEEKEVLVGLDRSNTNTGYRIGRLFAVLEKIQEEAQPGINATIRDRFYGAASATPITVFPQLLKLKNHHLAKLNPGRKINIEKEIQEIFDSIKTFPSHLALDEQALFAVGYYHQRQDFFTKRDTDNKII